ncbi:hypothetical protein TrRE_jg8859 [Triparma retinervis]|uniref:Uncharacterized protein n=1 Tax=Triparma retinervis TaxID=2557542 RepID=A0A9W7A4S7_9STRA|nr:hypothetical protein TrRE_jg8859 [Triparma retinervis]
MENFKQLQAYISSIPITKNNPPSYPSEMTTAKLPPMKDFLGWNVRLFHGGKLDFEGELAQALYVVPCTRAEYDNHTLEVEDGVLEGKVELYKRMDVAMLISVLDHVSRPFTSSTAASPVPPIISAYLSSADGHRRANVCYGLMSCIPVPMHRDTQAMIRGLMRALCKIRAEVGGAEKWVEVLLSVGVGIGVVGRSEVFSTN